MLKKYKKRIIIGCFVLAAIAVAFVIYRKKQKTSKSTGADKESDGSGAIISQLDTGATRTDTDAANVEQSLRMVAGQ